MAGVPVGLELRHRGLRRGLSGWSIKEQPDHTGPQNPPKETDLDYCLPRTMSIESDHSQSRTRLNGRLGAQLQVSGKSTKWRGLMYEFENWCAEVEESAVPPEWPQGLNKAFLPWLGMRADTHNQSQRDLTEK